MWTMFNDYPVAWSTLEDILVGSGKIPKSIKIW